MGPHDDLAIKGQTFKEELWAYIDEFLKDDESFIKEVREAKHHMNCLLDIIDSFVDRPEYK